MAAIMAGNHFFSNKSSDETGLFGAIVLRLLPANHDWTHEAQGTKK
jgi:hypothetical protein